MKRIFTLLYFIGLFFTANAKQIDLITALKTAHGFLQQKSTAHTLKNSDHLQLIYTATSNSIAVNGFQAVNCFYVLNADHGFIIVAADDIVAPILAYSDEKVFTTDNICPSVRKWLDSYKMQIEYAIENNMSATEEIKTSWNELLNPTNNPITTRSPNTVNPLVKTKWDQPYPYNTLCPGSSVTGCVATAMAQILKYWNYPENGTGFHSFNSKDYGTLSVNFGSTTYKWSSMPNSISSSNSAIATLMYHCGVSVNMSYSPQESGAWVIENSPTPEANCEYAFKTYFGYKTSLAGKERKNYTDTEWKNLLKADLDANRPILYDGFGNGGGHCFVCDGYDNSDYFHFNWGWSGSFDGYFKISALNPGGTGTGGGTGSYNSGQQAVLGVEPASGGGSPTASLNLYDNLTASPSVIYYNDAFDISTNIINNGAVGFSGDYAAVVFDYDLNFIDFVEIKSGWTLQSGYIYTNGLTFSSTGLLSMLPGVYYVALFSRPTGGEWSIIGNGNYTNLERIDVINPNDIELYAPMTISNGKIVTQGQSVNVNLNIINNGATKFYGDYSVDLYDLNGDWVENIGSLSETSGLQSGYVYTAPYLDFTTPSLKAAGGTYLLAMSHKPKNGNWQLTGSTDFQNPIYITVKAASLSPDQFETNNVFAQAANLPLTFSSNVATRNTAGSNCHTGSDYDYYKLNLAAGFNYTITARIHDLENSGNGNNYSLDAQFSYSTDGVSWSDSYDDILTGNITVNNGGTLYFFVTPYFLGHTGTYLLDLSISRKAVTATNETALAEAIKIYPNPVQDLLHIDLNEFNQAIHRIKLYNNLGQEVLSTTLELNQKSLIVPVTNQTSGYYIATFESDKLILTKRIMINK
jgi:hypothetical protein